MSKRIFDLFFALLALFLLSGIIILALIIASLDTKSAGLFVQNRIGQHGKTFRIYKIKSLAGMPAKVTVFGRFLRASKLDELPQLMNIIWGQMSFVGPRPDVPGYADVVAKQDRFFLTLKPGLSGLASLKYRQEEQMLAKQPDPLAYNDTVIWPDKVRLNNWYAHHRSFGMDLLILCYTFLPFLHFDAEEFMAERGGSEGKGS